MRMVPAKPVLSEAGAPSMRALAEASRAAARTLSHAPGAQKNEALREMARALRDHRAQILAANEQDLATARAEGKNAAFTDRLALDEQRLEGVARAIEEVAALPDPIGEVTDHWTRPNGLRIEKVRIPLGVVLMIYESRPN